jgi:hypothetical protein
MEALSTTGQHAALTAENAPPPPAQAAAGEAEEEGDDTVKSINDALRGLFR